MYVQALDTAKAAAKQAEIAIKAAAEGATHTLLEAARNVRYVPQHSNSVARNTLC